MAPQGQGRPSQAFLLVAAARGGYVTYVSAEAGLQMATERAATVPGGSFFKVADDPWTPEVQVAGLLPGRAPGRLTEPAAPSMASHPSMSSVITHRHVPVDAGVAAPPPESRAVLALPLAPGRPCCSIALRPGASPGSPGKCWLQLAPGYHDGNREALALRGGLLRGSVDSVFDSEGPAAGIGTPAMA